MSALEGMNPQRVLYYFEEISKIPRGSGNCKGISDYLKNFGIEHGLDTIQDEALNIILKKPATPGYEDQPVMILQGHMDMVAVATPESGINMKTTPLKLIVDGDWLSAENTSLGGDDGIAVAYSLALLESDSIPHPALEVIITTEEEVGMDGARAIDLSSLKGKRLLNLDSEDEGIFLTGCAGGARVTCLLPLTSVSDSLPDAALKIRIDGLLGGHSGGEIHRGRANSNILAGELLT
ncbi:MAG: aminoacyl-histidine dipeptidase, partial [Lachnospiraceae bacterium]|nr:aminoacyl-histidine dipeptidase [Lachnospiraceae bacterium]